jgi:Cys-tRNA(Pro)/Cys-tRNA(Cys) deacylase
MHLPAHQFLDDRGIPYHKLTFPPATEKGAASVARVLGYSESQMVKTLIFLTDKGESVLIMLGGDKNAISSHLKQAIGSRNIKLAGPETVQATTGYAIGSIPPFHWQPPGFRSFVDAALMRESVLGVGAGVWGYEIILTPENLVQAAQAAVVNLTDRSQSLCAAMDAS